MISGSNGQDGTYAAALTTAPIDIDVSAWLLRCEWNDGAASGSQPSDVKVDAEYTLDAGYLIYLGVDDNYDAVRDYDYNDVVLQLISLDPADKPWGTLPPIPDFTVPQKDVESARREYLIRRQRRYEQSQADFAEATMPGGSEPSSFEPKSAER